MSSRILTFNSVGVLGGYTVAGPKENDGKLHGKFDKPLSSDLCGQNTFEKAERKMFEYALDGVLKKHDKTPADINAVFGGDLLNQIVSTSFAMREMKTGFLGLYNACGTFAESLILGACSLQSGFETVVCASGSHFSTAERQYRYPLELGVLRSPVTQWTATGVGATLLTTNAQNLPKITRATVGRVVDYGILDANNMGTAMAPSACDTLKTFFDETGARPSDYDLIVSGDLGKLGQSILCDLLNQEGYTLGENYVDAGASLYFDEQQTYQGGSGAACSALYFNSVILHGFSEKTLHKVLLVGTGALMSPTTSFQGESIPAIAHLVEVTA